MDITVILKIEKQITSKIRSNYLCMVDTLISIEFLFFNPLLVVFFCFCFLILLVQTLTKFFLSFHFLATEFNILLNF